MSVLSFLTNTASSAVLPATEQSSITTSITTLQSRMGLHFDSSAIAQHFRFGSSTRGTILPRSMDEQSDIDYMVVFSDGSATPQTYLNRLKSFVEKRYGSSEIYQSNPTIVLELNHIKFDLVPATKTWLGELQIPNAAGGWMTTNPNDFNATLDAKNKEFQVKGQKFRLTHVRLLAPQDMGHTLSFCANDRPVKTEPLPKLIPNLATIISTSF